MQAGSTRRSQGLWFMAVPGLVVLGCFTYGPAVAAAYLSGTDWTGVRDPTWIGAANYRAIFEDPTTLLALRNTLVIAVGLVVVSNVVGLALALALNARLKSRQFLRALFFLPIVASPLATAYIWRYIFDYDGALNQILRLGGLDSWTRTWLADPSLALLAILVVMVWQFSGLTMVIYIAGLQGIPSELTEAAEVDGASPWLSFRYIVRPLLQPAVILSVTLTTIWGLRVFDQVMGLTGGGPVDATETLATQVWRQSFEFGRFGYGTAIAILLAGIVTVLIAALTVVLRRGTRDI